jgi:hypothetical protein
MRSRYGDWRAANDGSNVAAQVSDDECRGLFRSGPGSVYAHFRGDGRFVWAVGSGEICKVARSSFPKTSRDRKGSSREYSITQNKVAGGR